MRNFAVAFLNIALFALPTAAMAGDDCKKASEFKYPASQYTVRFATKVKNNLSETLVLTFYKTKAGDSAPSQYAQKALAPGQSEDVTDKVPTGGWSTFSVKLESHDGSATFATTAFDVFNAGGGGKTGLSSGVFDSKIICDRRWNSDKHHWVIKYNIGG